jgi:hypothetical protein
VELNILLQAKLNPGGLPGPEIAHEHVVRIGDKVIQRRNDYGVHGEGLFNGEQGVVIAADDAAGSVTVRFGPERELTLRGAQLANLELAWAVTVHRSQGSEWPYVVMPYHGFTSPCSITRPLHGADPCQAPLRPSGLGERRADDMRPTVAVARPRNRPARAVRGVRSQSCQPGGGMTVTSTPRMRRSDSRLAERRARAAEYVRLRRKAANPDAEYPKDVRALAAFIPCAPRLLYAADPESRQILRVLRKSTSGRRASVDMAEPCSVDHVPATALAAQVERALAKAHVAVRRWREEWSDVQRARACSPQSWRWWTSR